MSQPNPPTRHVRFVKGNISGMVEIEARPSRRAQRLGYQNIERHRPKSLGRVSPEKLARLQQAAENEIRSRQGSAKMEKRGSFMVHYK